MTASEARTAAILARAKRKDILRVRYEIQASAEDGCSFTVVRIDPAELADIQTELEADGYRVEVWDCNQGPSGRIPVKVCW